MEDACFTLHMAVSISSLKIKNENLMKGPVTIKLGKQLIVYCRMALPNHYQIQLYCAVAG